LLPVTRTWFAAVAATHEPGYAEAMRAVAGAQGPLPEAALATLAGKPAIAALLRTTCVATQVSGGTGKNVLPAAATANVNCRILPDETPEDVRRALVEIVGDPGVEIVAAAETVVGKPAPLDGEGPAAVGAVMARIHPGVPVIPKLVNYYTDSRSLTAVGIAAYGLGVLPLTEQDGLTAHAANERIPVAGLRSGVEFLHALVVELAAAKSAGSP